ncbi:discoidin domain-containing protein [Cohnella silvisoli]|uniref:Discoidin domain-containing protein n=1 Tax=Cohnella silvisoli TaxID=2873699 RepID=A0ABV1L2W8_9BACL|nr:discoidin domain-containing protein [Cohnella silvisoli]MCD9025851.1 discoidin domain-containing protein [Cohnella silvisoli]
MQKSAQSRKFFASVMAMIIAVGCIAFSQSFGVPAVKAQEISGRYKDPALQVPNVIVAETQAAGVRFNAFDPTVWDFSEALSDEFNGSTLSDKWHQAYMDWWPIQQNEGVGGSIPTYTVNNGVLTLIADPSRPFWWDRGLAKHDGYRGVGIMGGAKDYVNNGPQIDGVPIQKHVPYMDALATTYGFFEVRTKIDRGATIIPAIWFVGFHDKGGNSQNAEIDIPEFFNAEDYPQHNNKLGIWHIKDPNAFPERPSSQTDISMYLNAGEDYRDDWHTIGMEWAPGYVRYFFDGHLIREHAVNINYRMIPIFSINHRAEGVLNPPKLNFNIDYYRVWKNRNVTDPYKAPTLPATGNIASYAKFSMFGQTSGQFNATPPERLNDGDLISSVYSGLQLNSPLPGRPAVTLEHTPLPAYIYADFHGSVNYNTVNLYATMAQSQAPTLVDIETSATGEEDSVWTPVAQNVRLNWWTNSNLAEGMAIRFPDVTNNKHMRIVVKESNFNANKKFAVSEIEVGQNIPLQTEQNIALNKTATAISQNSHTSAMAVDGNAATWWSAGNGNANNWWQVDLGRSYNLSGSELEFLDNTRIWKYKVEVSSDNTNWTMVMDQTANTSSEQTQTHHYSAAARYVRVTVTETPGTAWTAFSEFRVFGTPVNIALNKTASAISQNTNTAQRANDGDTGTWWSAGNGNNNNWWKVDLGSNLNLAGSEIVWPDGSGPWKYKVEVSTNNSIWTTVADNTANNSTAQTQTHSFTANARYVRVYVTDTPGTAWTAIKEFRVFGQ